MHKLCFIAVFFSLLCKAQLPKPSHFERCWALAHPFAAFKIKRLSTACNKVYIQSLNRFSTPDFKSGGGPDAYRHTLFMAVFAQKIRIKKLRKLGQAHEKSNYAGFKKNRVEFGERADSLASVMDLHNNELGFKLGAANKSMSLNELNDLIFNELKNGKALIFRRKKNGVYVDCLGNEINPDDFKGKWYIPKCLVASNVGYID